MDKQVKLSKGLQSITKDRKTHQAKAKVGKMTVEKRGRGRPSKSAKKCSDQKDLVKSFKKLSEDNEEILRPKRRTNKCIADKVFKCPGCDMCSNRKSSCKHNLNQKNENDIIHIVMLIE